MREGGVNVKALEHFSLMAKSGSIGSGQGPMTRSYESTNDVKL